MYTFWGCCCRGAADGGSQLFRTKQAVGTHGDTERLTLTCVHTHASTHTCTHTHTHTSGSPGSQLDLHGVTRSPSPRTSICTRSQWGHLCHPGTAVRVTHLHHSPRCQLWLTCQHLQRGELPPTVKAAYHWIPPPPPPAPPSPPPPPPRPTHTHTPLQRAKWAN